MGRDFRRILTGLGLLFSMVPLAWAVTGMVAVQIDLSRAGTSPDGLRRARQTALDMESTLMDRLFDDGHIAFNAPSEIHQPDAAEPLTAIENLLSRTRYGGGSLLFFCQIRLSEPAPGKALSVDSCSVSLVPTYVASGFPQTLNLPVNPAMPDSDLKTAMARMAATLMARVATVPPPVPGGRYD